jgi:hypothetical protein
MPSVRTWVASCIRPGRIAPSHSGRPCPSLIIAAFSVFCFFLPDTNALRPGRFAFGRRTCTSVPSMRNVIPSASA